MKKNAVNLGKVFVQIAVVLAAVCFVCLAPLYILFLCLAPFWLRLP